MYVPLLNLPSRPSPGAAAGLTRCSARRPKEDRHEERRLLHDLCQRLQRCVDSYRNSEAGIRDFNQGRERPLHIRETGEAIEAIRTLLAREPKED
jgi:hypothetical protein